MVKRPPDPPADRRSQIARKLGDAAWFLPLVGVLLLATPLISAVTGEGEAVLPRALLYIFGVWAALIVLAAFLAHRLKDEEKGP